MFNADPDRSSAESLIARAKGFLEQNEYEYQRTLASLHLLLRQIESTVQNREITRAAVEAINNTTTEIKYQLRNARHEMGGAEDQLNELHNTLIALDGRMTYD